MWNDRKQHCQKTIFLLTDLFFYLILMPNYVGSTVDGSSIFN